MPAHCQSSGHRPALTTSPANSAPSRSNFELLLLAILACLWGSSYLFTKIAVATIPPLTLVAGRVSLATIFLLLILAFQSARLPRDWRTWRMLLVQSFCNSIASWTLLAWAQQHVASSLAGVLNSTSPLFVFFLTLLVDRTAKADGWKLFGTLLGLVGVALVVGADSMQNDGKPVIGPLAVLGSAFLYACAALYGRRFASLSPTVTASGTMLWASAFLLPASLVIDRPWTLDPSPAALLAVLALGFLCTGVALLIYFRLVRTLGALGVASQSYLRAGVSVLLGVGLLGEQLTAGIGVGLVAVVAGVVIINTQAPASLLRTLRGKR